MPNITLFSCYDISRVNLGTDFFSFDFISIKNIPEKLILHMRKRKNHSKLLYSIFEDEAIIDYDSAQLFKEITNEVINRAEAKDRVIDFFAKNPKLFEELFERLLASRRPAMHASGLTSFSDFEEWEVAKRKEVLGKIKPEIFFYLDFGHKIIDFRNPSYLFF